MAPSAKRREVSGESKAGWAASCSEPLARRTFLRTISRDDSVEWIEEPLSLDLQKRRTDRALEEKSYPISSLQQLYIYLWYHTGAWDPPCSIWALKNPGGDIEQWSSPLGVLR